jgi:hypothetical protein
MVEISRDTDNSRMMTAPVPKPGKACQPVRRARVRGGFALRAVLPGLVHCSVETGHLIERAAALAAQRIATLPLEEMRAR